MFVPVNKIIQQIKNKMAATETKYNYDFKNKRVKKAFQTLAIENDTTLQNIITEALKSKYPKLIK